jgi:aminoglycoside 6'-N-acetyltransferase I
MIRVRPATPDDAAGWLRMRDALWPHHEAGSHAGEVEQYFAGKLRMPLEVLLAFDETGTAVGFAELSIRSYAEHCETDRVAYLEGWYVDQGFRRQGVGRALVAAAEDWGIEQGCTEFGSDAVLENEVSAVAHRALGFEETVRLRCFKKVLSRKS